MIRIVIIPIGIILVVYLLFLIIAACVAGATIICGIAAGATTLVKGKKEIFLISIVQAFYVGFALSYVATDPDPLRGRPVLVEMDRFIANITTGGTVAAAFVGIAILFALAVLAHKGPGDDAIIIDEVQVLDWMKVGVGGLGVLSILFFFHAMLTGQQMAATLCFFTNMFLISVISSIAPKKP